MRHVSTIRKVMRITDNITGHATTGSRSSGKNSFNTLNFLTTTLQGPLTFFTT
ncbi:hypothetical protein HanPSC8_Chr02g0075311 [Helianthus annuus]|nr:hypothetical protein HanPSC8_Chr02g0075311 [Helianthus annuus]